MKRKLQFMPKAIHDRRSIHGEANSFKPSLEGKGDHAVVDESYSGRTGDSSVFSLSANRKLRYSLSTHRTVPGAISL